MYLLNSACRHCRDPLLQAAEGIRQSIASGNEAVIPGLVDTLLSDTRPFDERRIGGGPWQVHTTIQGSTMVLRGAAHWR